MIVRDTAAGFLADLHGRLTVFEEHPSGQTPATVHDETLALVRSGDRIGLDEHLRRERHDDKTAFERVAADASQKMPNDKGQMRCVWEELRPLLERRLAALLPLAMHDLETFASEARHLAAGIGRRVPTGGYVAWSELPEYAATWIGYVCGAVLVHMERYDSLAPLLQQRWTNQYGNEEPLVWLPGQAQYHIGLAMAEEGGPQWIAPGWEHLHRSIKSMSWLEERYPELYGNDEPLRSMAQFDLLICLRQGLLKQDSVAFFVLGGGAAEEFALRLHNDPALRARIAMILQEPLEAFETRGAAALREAGRLQGGFTANPARAAAFLENGKD